MSRRAPALQVETLFDLPLGGGAVAALGTGALTLELDRSEAAMPVEGRQQPASAEMLEMPLLERMQAVRGTANFLPTSRGEINEAFALLSFLHEPGKTARHLNEVLRHQQKSRTDDPAAAVRSITREYAGYARKARADCFNLTAMQQELDEYSQNDGSKLRMLKDAGRLTGTAQFVRHRDLSRLAGTGEQGIVSPFQTRSDGKRSALDPYTITEPTDEMTEHIAQELGSVRIWEAQKGIGAMITDQQNRFSFWTDRLREARAHSVALPVANAALQALGVEA
jgi:hypothetical protein